MVVRGEVGAKSSPTNQISFSSKSEYRPRALVPALYSKIVEAGTSSSVVQTMETSRGSTYDRIHERKKTLLL